MATVQNSLQLFDAFSQPLQHITQALHLAESAMQRMQQTLDRNNNMGKTFDNAASKVAEAESEIQSAIDKSTRSQEKFNHAVKNGEKSSRGLLDSIKGMAAAYLGMEAAKKLTEATIGGAMEQEKMQDMFKARTGSDEVGAAMFEKFKSDALKAGMDVQEALKGTLSFFSTTQDTKQLEKLNNLTQRLNAFDSSGNGLEGAAFALKEAMSGDIVSLAERFNMSKTDIRAFKIDELGKSGDMDGFIKAFDQLLEKQKMGQAAFDKMLASPAKQAEILQNNLKSGMADAGSAAMRGLLPLIQLLNTSFKEGRFDGLFKSLEIGLRVTAILLSGLIQGALWFGDVVQWLGPVIWAMLIATGTMISVHLIAKLWAAIPPLYQLVAGWLTMNWPILLVIAAVGVLVLVLKLFGVTTEQIVGGVTGYFMVLFGYIYNQVAFLWNYLASFAEFFINLFIDPVYAVKKLFYDLATLFLGQMNNMVKAVESFAGSFMSTILKAVNEVLKGFNWLAEKANGMFGTDFKPAKLFDENNVHAISDSITKLMDQIEKPVSDKNVVSFARMGTKDLKNEFDYGYKAGSNLVGKVKQATDFSSVLDGWNKNVQINRVDEVGKIKDKVDISSEDLKVMRDLAEMKNIQNFVTLTPVVQVQTGDIRNDVDLDEIVRKIEDKMIEEITHTAEGIYNG